jgi:3-hydroxyisobutyrate dehydrogenase-like beta-hydroxyacid dehydrogenase
MNVGFIGLGQMGAGMASNLLKAGHELTVYNRTAAKAKPLGTLGARVAASVGDACDGEVVITMVANDAALEDVVFAERGMLSRLPPGAVHVSMSTISVALAERLTEAHARAGQAFISAPVFGRPDVAVSGKLFIIASGAPEAMQRVEPLLGAIGQSTLQISEQPRDANLVKIGGNFMIVSMTQAFGEAIALMRKAGIEPQAFVEAMTTTIFNVPIYKNYGGIIASEKFSPPGFAAVLGHKDIGLALDAADTLRVPMPLAHLLRDRLMRLVASKEGDSLDLTALAALNAGDAGLR